MSASLFAKLWIYQAERFPLAKTVPLLAVFSAASINVSAVLAGRQPPAISGYVVGLILGLVIFFQMRVLDEVKDREVDAKYRPERPIPRGLVSLRLIVGLAAAAGLLAVATTWLWTPVLMWLLALAWLWLAAMSFEFGARDWLRERLAFYMVSHMAIMPLIDLLLTGIEWVPHARPASGLWVFLALSFVNGCVLELGRKIWAPESEREGVESYSAIWGPKKAIAIWGGFVALAFALLLGLGWLLGALIPIAVIGFVGVLACLRILRDFRRAPTPQAEKRVDMISGLWVFLCYGAAGFAPVLLGAL